MKAEPVESATRLVFLCPFESGAVILLEEQWLIDYNKLEIKRYFTVGLVCLSRLEKGPLGEIHEIQ